MDEFYRGKKVVSSFKWLGVPTASKLDPDPEPPEWFSDAIRNGMVSIGIDWCDIKTPEGWEKLIAGCYLLRLEDESIYPKKPELLRGTRTGLRSYRKEVEVNHLLSEDEVMELLKYEAPYEAESRKDMEKLNEFYQRKLKEDPNWKPKFTQTSIEVSNTKGELTYSTKLTIE